MKKSKRYEIRLSGSGGQGLIMAGILLADAVSIYGKYNVIQSQSYGPEARGGASKSEVIISDEAIYYPKALKLDLLLCLSQDACDKFYRDLKGNGMLVVDTTYVKSPPLHDLIHAFPLTSTAIRELGKSISTNILSLGLLAGLVPQIDLEGLKTAVRKRMPPHIVEMNLKALDIGYGLAPK
ncbi:MAG: 2-oxoacid:acceptor oxidoreductase family protein [Candidatus Wallbacteria bacterium]|nr:2-oxoacid:acceptor oxidoreductase family protein [Candidatus Wallbacteria bacterium]